MKTMPIPPRSSQDFSSVPSPDPSSPKSKGSLLIPPTVWFLGSAMCLMNISFVILFSLSALYMNTAMNVAVFWIMVMEGTVEAISFIMKLFSGVISDYFRKRKPVMIIGYFFALISKPIFALSYSPFLVFLARMFERVGNGIQATPRDAMVGDVAPANYRASNFGLLRTLGTAGSCLGALSATILMSLLNDNFRQVFMVATIPATVAFFILLFLVKEPKSHVSAEGEVVETKSDKRPIRVSDLKLLGVPYWKLMIVVGIFMMARFSETIIVLHAHTSFGLEKKYAPLIMFAYNLTYSLFSFPSGFLADRYGRRMVLILGIGALIISDFLLFSARGLEQVGIGILLWGIQMAAVHNTFVSLITDYVPDELRGTGIGFYYLVQAMGSVFVGVFGGTITTNFGYTGMFLCSMMLAICALLVLLTLLPGLDKKINKSLNI